MSDGACGFPDVSFHGITPWHNGPFSSADHYVGVAFAGWGKVAGPQLVYVASNAYWEDLQVVLPSLPAGMCWQLVADTWDSAQQPRPQQGDNFTIRRRSVMVFESHQAAT